MTQQLDTVADRMAEVRAIAEEADRFATLTRAPMAAMIARLARAVEADMRANDPTGLAL